MNSDSSKQKEIVALISVLRAIVNSRKQPCSLLAVMRDYYELENRELPFRAFGFNTALDLFLQSDEFYVENMSGEIYVAAKRNRLSGHITDFVRQQKSSGRKKHQTKVVTAPSRPKIRQTGLTHYKSASPPISHLGNQRQYAFKEELKHQLEKNLHQQLQYELEKQKKQLQLNFEKEKEILEKAFLSKFKDASVVSNTTISDELKKLHNRLDQVEASSVAAENSFFEEEIKENKRTTAELKQLKERLSLLTSYAENNNLGSSMLSPKKHQMKDRTTKGQSQQPQTTAATANPKRTQNTLFSNNKQNHADNNSGLPPTDLRHRLNAMRSPIQSEQPILSATAKNPSQNESLNLRPILGQYNNVGNQQGNLTDCNTSNCNNNKMSKNHLQKSQPPKQTFQQSQAMEPANLTQKNFALPTSMPLQQPQQPSVRCIPKQPSVQNRLKLNVNCDRNSVNGNPAMQSEIVGQAPSIESKIEITKPPALKPNTLSATTNRKIWKFDPKLDPCTSIALYCAARKCGDPEYNVFRSKQGLYDCQLIINTNTIYSTYPQEYTTEAKARFACAEKALQQIQIAEERSLLPTFPDDKEFLKVLYNELLLHPHGIISDKMSGWCVDKFGYTVPVHWFMLIKNSACFTIEDGIKESTFIILANKGVDIDSDNAIALGPGMLTQMEPLKLPWSEKCWELYITHCVSTVEIWACLLGAEYNVRFDAFMAELNSHMNKEKVRPDVIAPKHIYLVEVRSCWHRVRVESLDKEKQKTLCFYIDFGDTEYLSVNELYLCDPKFLWLAPQAVPLSLFGLEDFAGNPNAIKELEKRLLNRAVIGEIVTKEADFEANSIIRVIMFDTSTEDDINLNLLLQKEICNQSKLPQLRPQGTTSVIITHIDNRNGDVSLQIIDADSEYVHKTLKQIVESKFNDEQHKCSPEELLQPQILLVYDDEQNLEWCRAKLIDFQQVGNPVNCQDKMIDVMYIDYNIRRRVNISKIYRLESLSKALSKFPPQAIRVKLHNISEFSQNIIGRMHALLPGNCQAFVRVEIPGDLPHVTILRRVNGPDMPYCNINDDLCLEIERAKDATLCEKDSPNGSALSPTSEPLQSPSQLFRSSILSTTSMLPLKISELPKLREYDINLRLNSIFSVNVILVSNPLSFTVQPYNDDFQRLVNMMKELQNYCVNNDAFILADMIEIGQAYAAKKEEDYYRVIAKTRYGEMINVSFCDYGDSGTVHSDHLKVLPAQFRQLPKMGINARLYGLKGNSDDVWSTDDVQRFRNLVLGKKMSSFIKGSKRDEKGTLELSLDLVDVQGEEDINIRKILLDEKRAIATSS